MNSFQQLKRNRPGTKGQDLYHWSPEEYDKTKGLFSVQEYIQELIRDNPSNIEKIITPPTDVDLIVWKYEHIRQFVLETNLLIVQLQTICTKQSCPKMKATDDWLFMCTHPPNNITSDCCAIDYMIHNIDQFTSILNNSKYFPSRVTIPSTSESQLNNIVRRLYRFFSHTYFHHVDVFDEFEREMHLCERFTEFIKKNDILPSKLIIIPSKAFSCHKGYYN
jgi:hypothetical protein